MRISLMCSGGTAVLAVLTMLLTTGPARADEASIKAEGDEIFSTRLETGYRVAEIEDDASFLFPYDPLEDGPVFGFDLLFLKPAAGTIRLDGGYLAPDSWQADASYNRGADFAVSAATRRFQQTRPHLAPVGTILTPVEVEGLDESPGEDYRFIRQDTRAAVKVRAPGYPAHLTASGRVERREGDEQMRYFFRTCSTHFCHMNSRTRPIDQVTREYTVGFDAHAGPVDLAYSRTSLTWRDDAADPVVTVGDITATAGGLPAGDYEQALNPDLRSFADTVKLNTNLTSRGVLSLSYQGGEEENETSGIVRRLRNAGAVLSWRFPSGLLLTTRYAYDEERTGGISDDALGLREANNAAHATGGWSHQHTLRPEQTRHTGEINAQFHPAARADMRLVLRHRGEEERISMHLNGDVYDDAPVKTRSTFAGVNGAYRFGAGLSLDATAGQEWTADPAYSVETTSLTRFGLGGTWSPAEPVVLRVSYQGYRGKNDKAEVLQQGYEDLAEPDLSFERTVSGDAFSVAATWVPCRIFSLTGSWNLTDGGIEQDQVFGDSGTPGFAYTSRPTSWDGRTQVADLRAVWSPTTRLTLTASGMWIDSLESYAPSFPEAEGLEEIGAVEFTKLLATLQADVRISRVVGVTVSGFWARYDDQDDDAGDGSASGAIAALNLRW